MRSEHGTARLRRRGSSPGTWSLAVVGVFCLAGCNGPAPSPAQNVEPALSPDAAREFVASAEDEIAARSEQIGRVSWVYNNFITYDTERLLEQARAESIEADVRLAKEAARFADADVDAETRRKLDRLRLGLTLPAPQSDGAAAELAQITTRLASTYSKGRIDLDGASTTLDELEVLMREVRDPAKLEEMWTQWRDVAKPMAADYARMVDVANAGARELGFEDVGRMWLSKYDMPADAMAAEVDKLWSEVRPLYDELYCHVRARLNEHYGDSIVPLDQPLRADLLGNMWAQDWSALDDLVGPPESDPGYDVTELLAEQSYDAEGIVRTGERFYTSLGLPALPDSFWERSLLTRPADRDVVCHASAWNIDSRDDIRIKMCIHVNGDDFGVVHHELGHVYYSRAYQEQSPSFRSGAHDGFHEAIGDFIALNVTPEYLVQIGLLPPNRLPSAQSDLSLLMRVALDKIAFLPFAYTMDQWRWDVFSGRGHTGNLQRRLVDARAAQPGRQAAERSTRRCVRSGREVSHREQRSVLTLLPRLHPRVPVLRSGMQGRRMGGTVASLLALWEPGSRAAFQRDARHGRVQAVAGRPRGFYRLPRDERLGPRRVLRAAHDVAQAAERRPAVRLVKLRSGTCSSRGTSAARLGSGTRTRRC